MTARLRPLASRFRRTLATLRSALLLFALVPLAGCWMGGHFYTAAESRPAIAPGVYRVSGGDPRRGPVRVSLRPDGLTRIAAVDGKEAPSVMGFAPLDGSGRRFVMWQQEEDAGSEADGVAYGLIERQGRSYLLLLPVCERSRAVAVAAGATVSAEPKVTICLFPDRAKLEAALRAVKPDQGERVRLTPA